MTYKNKDNKINISASVVHVGEGVTFGKNVDIAVKGYLHIGDYSHIGSNTRIRGNDISIGKHFYGSGGLRIGGGGSMHPQSNLVIGDRCTMHNNLINIAKSVSIGDDVGLSPEVTILTHGYWQNVLEGYPARFAPVTIGNNVIIGYRSVVMPCVLIANGCVVGAQSVVTKSLTKKGIYAGSPARKVGEPQPLTEAQQESLTRDIIDLYIPVADYHDLKPSISLDFPWVIVDGFRFNVLTFEYEGEETVVTDDVRDYFRKFGIRIYTNRPFKSNFSFK